jgi:Nif-specific regulatory protein
MAVLKLMVEGNCVEVFSLGKKRVVVGRKDGCDICLIDRSISSTHAEITRNNKGRCQIKDLKSRNGVWINGKKKKSAALNYGDEIILGKTHLLFSDETSKDYKVSSFKPENLFVQPHTEEPFSFQILHKDYEGLKESYEKLLQFYEVSKSINSTLDYHAFLEQVMDILRDLLKAERGFIAFLDESTGEFTCQISRGFESVEGGGKNLPVSSFMIDRVREGDSILTVDASEDVRFRKRESVQEFHIQSVMCVPLFLREKVLGIIYIDSRITTTSFAKGDLEFLIALGNQVSIAVENVNLHKQLVEENLYLHSVISSHDKIIGESEVIKQLYSIIGKVSNHDSAVLITGETGTGKELVARAIHNNSPRKNKPFICVTCSLLSSTLIESELFGHERGAFTGAVDSKQGRLETANGGTIFLDEIGDVAPEVQVKLLRFLEQKEIVRIGGNRTIKLNVRVLAATNRDLSEGIKDGSFREDLFYRLNSIQIKIPPLRHRVEDIPVLAGYFLDEFSKEMGRTMKKISSQAMDLMRIYEWPGNVRELRNTMERAMVLGGGEAILPLDLPEEIRKLGDRLPVAFPPLSQMERDHIIQALKLAGGNKTQAAAILRIGRATLYEKVKQYNIS